LIEPFQPFALRQSDADEFSVHAFHGDALASLEFSAPKRAALADDAIRFDDALLMNEDVIQI